MQPVLPDDVPINRIRIERPHQLARPVITDRPEDGTVQILTMSRQQEELFNQSLGQRMQRHVSGLIPLALDLKTLHPLTALDVFHPQPAQFFPPQTMVGQRRQNGPVAHALERVFGWCFQQTPRLCVRERRGTTLIAVRQGALHAIDRVAGHGVKLAQIIEQGK